MTDIVERYEDMSHAKLRVLQQEDGDIIVGVVPDSDEPRHYVQSVEFCSCGCGGGKSPRTLRALRNLMQAMQADNRESPQVTGCSTALTSRSDKTIRRPGWGTA